MSRPHVLGTAAVYLSEAFGGERGGTLKGRESEYDIGFASPSGLAEGIRSALEAPDGYYFPRNLIVVSDVEDATALDALRKIVENDEVKLLSFEIEDEVDRYRISAGSETERIVLKFGVEEDGHRLATLTFLHGDFEIHCYTVEGIGRKVERSIERNGYFLDGNLLVLKTLADKEIERVVTEIVREDSTTWLAVNGHYYGGDITL